ncbi:cell wall-binding repeat-containing protein [Coriobacteriia bacterium Es71-Z0120]|uniref:cell wall-binding repeat-containing protein n=1 Tax=Parvivirga hydrogeniphila TaxID=2939460 RepID=UPI0022608310|nr:cell wall-binding repeat-containing protein [Parvivirga hydrogeniphila]MCL4078792.1 cell wall-binding repeat-containing protein [Parvivirga hydrogeniphila]
MRRSKHIHLASVALALLLVCSSLPLRARALEPAAIPTFTISGGGWGHGIGLSQYGSQGFALHGYTYDWIIKHYFQGTSIQKASNAVEVRVNLDKDSASRQSWTVRSVDATMTVYDGAASVKLPKNTYYTFTNDAGVVVTKYGTGSVVATFTGSWVKADPDGEALFEVKDPSGPPLHRDYPSGYPYVRWRGRFEVTRDGTQGLYAWNLVPLEQYLYGVVPRESPASWKPEALKAQAVAARSYAKAKIDPNDDGKRDNSLACTTADQVYGGHSRLSNGTVVMHEASSTNAAVDATRDLIAKDGSTIVMTFFHSSSGGNTANIEDVWPSATPKSYYTGVESPYEADAGNPNQSWTETMDGLAMAGKLGAPPSVYVRRVSIERGSSGYPKSTTFYFSNGTSTTLGADSVRIKLGLKSPNFWFFGFPMQRIAGADRYATAVEVSKKAYPTTSAAVVLASGEQYPDALSGSALAGAAKGPLLLTRPNELPDAVRIEVTRLKPAKVYVLGGAGAVSDDVLKALKSALPSAEVTRVGGVDRYETSAKVAALARSMKATTKAFVVSGESWADAAAVSPVAYRKGYPVLLVRRWSVPSATAAFLAAAKPAEVQVVGGPSVVDESVEASVAALTGGAAGRLYGGDRYETAAAVARWALGDGFTATEPYLATGLTYPDALAASALAGTRGFPLLLMRRDSVPEGTAAFLREHKLAISTLWLLGGPGAISDAGEAALESAMAQ